MRLLPVLAAARLEEAATAGVDPNDILELARRSIVAVMRGHGGPRSMERLAVARTVLSREFLPLLTDDQLMFEVQRRIAQPAASP